MRSDPVMIPSMATLDETPTLFVRYFLLTDHISSLNRFYTPRSTHTPTATTALLERVERTAKAAPREARAVATHHTTMDHLERVARAALERVAKEVRAVARAARALPREARAAALTTTDHLESLAKAVNI
jgi:hypothetical protein